jgi:hypothetical protein
MADQSDIDVLMTREQRFKARKWDKMFVSRSVITSKAFLALKTACACQVYLIFLSKRRWEKVQTRPMRREKEWRITNNGEIQFTYGEAEQKYGISAGKFTRAIDDLIRVGLIDITRSGLGLKKDVTLYAISDRWQKYGTDEFVVKKRPKRRQHFGFAGRKRRLSPKMKSTFTDSGCTTCMNTR